MIDLMEHLPGLPSHLREKAFSVGTIPWPAWAVPEALAVVEHLRSRSLAVTWLYSATKTPTDSWTHYTTEVGGYYSDYNPYIGAEESWDNFVERTCAEASDLLRDFEPIQPIITPEPFKVGFLLMWEPEENLAALHEQRVSRILANRPALSLEDEIVHFRDWADPRIKDGEHSCWEADYYNWPQVGQAFAEFLQKRPFRHWDSRTISDVLYIIARDNEAPSLASAVAEEPERLLFLAQAAIESSERDAKWQLAVEMSRLDRLRYPIEPLLLALFQDEDEYVRRQALMALGRIHSPLVEGLVAAAWETGDEYQRIAVLQVLHDRNSPQMTSYLEKAEQDGRRYLRAFAARLKAATT